MKRLHWILAAMMVGLAGAALAAEQTPVTLKVGDPAPKLQTGEWVQGEPVKAFEPNKAYIVEFWATWCGPCRTSIPHLNELWEKYKDKGLIVIGQDVWEQKEEEVPKFVKQMGEKMTYRVALDDKQGSDKGKMAETWMMAAGQRGIPAAFLVDKKGRIAWIGHPMQLKEATIDRVLAGTFDVEKEAAAYEQRQKNEAALQQLQRTFGQSMAKQEWDKAETALADMEKLLPEGDRGFINMTRFRLQLNKKDYAAAMKTAAKASEAYEDNAMLQNELAWAMVTAKGVPKDDLDLELAEKIANRGNTAAKGKDPAILDTLARVLFMKGEKQKAIATQEKAISLADGAMRSQLEKTLKSYKDNVLPDAQ